MGKIPKCRDDFTIKTPFIEDWFPPKEQGFAKFLRRLRLGWSSVVHRFSVPIRSEHDPGIKLLWWNFNGQNRTWGMWVPWGSLEGQPWGHPCGQGVWQCKQWDLSPCAYFPLDHIGSYWIILDHIWWYTTNQHECMYIYIYIYVYIQDHIGSYMMKYSHFI